MPEETKRWPIDRPHPDLMEHFLYVSDDRNNMLSKAEQYSDKISRIQHGIFLACSDCTPDEEDCTTYDWKHA
ncbi:hypothetical protein OUZ56_010074 [Daphnia magna]|uniref:Uncharacterized protein n=1 Tax=Daphnia magna TaxID=35525 RepID=A0ABR0AHQ1_9CRUS|nr:hypothetical protein OUZ56_010074 [Daphnia magna]